MPQLAQLATLTKRHWAHLCAQVGGWVYMHRDDLSRVAPLWLQYTEDVREDPEVRMCCTRHAAMLHVL